MKTVGTLEVVIMLEEGGPNTSMTGKKATELANWPPMVRMCHTLMTQS